MNHELFLQIRYLKTMEHLSSGQIADRLEIPERTVRNWWKLERFPEREMILRSKKIDDFIPRIEALLKDCPTLSGTQIYQKIHSFGFTGSASGVRRFLTGFRKERKPGFLTLHFDPGEAMQIDFGDCGTLRQGGKNIRLCICAAVLCHSRLLFAKLIPSEKQEYTFAFLMEAFDFFQGVPRKLIVDNFKAAVIRHPRNCPAEFHPGFLDFCAHYGTLPVACNVRAPYEKGRIENGIGYIKGNFLRGNTFNSMEEAQCSLRNWLDTIANVRIHNSTRRRPLELFEETEKAALTPVNPHAFDCGRMEHRHVDSRCRFKCEGSHYSVPETCANREVVIKITPQRIYVYLDKRQITSHLRSQEKNAVVDDPGHFKVMFNERQMAARQNLTANFLALDADAAAIKREIEDRSLDVNRHIRKIMTLVDIYGKEPVVNAMHCAVQNQVFGSDYIEYILRLKMRPAENFQGVLHVTQGADNLNLQLDAPDMSIYDIE